MKRITLLLVTLSLAFPPLAFAENNVRVRTDDSSVEVKINNEVNTSSSNRGSSENRVQVSAETNGTGTSEVKIENNTGNNIVSIKNNEFEVSGAVTSVSGNTFVVASQSINFDASKFGNIVKLGNRVKAEGTISNGQKNAREVELISSNSSSNSSNISIEKKEDDDNASPTPTSSVNPSPSARTDIRIRINGPIDQVKAILENILETLKNMF